MRQNNLSNTGLSMSQAQSISNLCNQYAKEIENIFSKVNNFSKSVDTLKGGALIVQTTQKGVPLPEDTLNLITKKARYHACQAFLLENIKAKEDLLLSAKSISSNISSINLLLKHLSVDSDTLKKIHMLGDDIIANHAPESPRYMLADEIPNVDEEFGWAALTISEINEYLEAEAYASHLGQFIHQKGVLSKLRDGINSIPDIEWMNIKDDEKTPIFITVHHTPEDLLKLHSEIEKQHRDYEHRVNYFKAKVKNLVTIENARISELNIGYQTSIATTNAEMSAKFQQELQVYRDKIQTISREIEKYKHAVIKEIAALRISIPARFQPIIDIFTKELKDGDEDQK